MLYEQYDLERSVAVEVQAALRSKAMRVVFAESCTGGRVSAVLASLPGISESLCGGFVVYRSASKTGWLGISAADLEDEKQGPVSPKTSSELASAALLATAEADLAVAVTGDLGPNAPNSTDGCVFIAAATRDGSSAANSSAQLFRCQHSFSSGHADGEVRDEQQREIRLLRQVEATIAVLRFTLTQISG